LALRELRKASGVTKKYNESPEPDNCFTGLPSLIAPSARYSVEDFNWLTLTFLGKICYIVVWEEVGTMINERGIRGKGF
jgi:hypothetical protein